MTGSVNGTNIFLNDPQNLSGFSQVLEELPSVGATPTVTYTLGSQIISQKKSGTVSHLMADGHGSTRLLTGSTGAISDRYTYDAYGKALDFTFGTLTPPTTRLLYCGEQLDPDLQQYYFRARYYNPTVGRFGAMDQVDGSPNDPLSLHKYAYTQNNPVNMRDPSGNESLVELTISFGIQSMLAINPYDIAVGYLGTKLTTEGVNAGKSLQQIEGQDARPNVDTATIIVHGVAGHKNGWSKPFQANLGPIPRKPVWNPPLNHDFFEFDWGGFSLDSIPLTLIPIQSVHQMAFVHLQMAQMLVWMKGYGNIDIISHSWGTALSYDLMNSGGIEMHDWVTMGSPLKSTTDKPVWNTGRWINYYSLNDPVTHFEVYPPFPSFAGMRNNVLRSAKRLGVDKDGLTADPNVTLNHRPYSMGGFLLGEHSAYWDYIPVLSDLRLDLQ